MDVRARSSGFRQLAVLLSGLLLVNPWLVSAAPLVVNNTAGGNTRLGAAGNGVPLVDIATPSASGLSHNQFREYNVGAEGLILNNSANKLQSTQLGGYINGNPNLKGRAAQVILNEVTGTNRSTLKGYTEVAGSSAQVIVANPHGITCDGCGFINTPKATLTTGTPEIKDGHLERYEVNGGDILIDGIGLDASTMDAFELITRSARINARLHANQLHIVAGRNSVDAKTLQATAKADDGSDKPLLAIDSSLLGGMYAGVIKLVGTEDGVGVKLSGDMAASSADIEIDANGKLTVTRSASGRDMRLSAKDVTLEGDAYAAGKVQISGEAVTVQQTLASGGNLQISARQVDNQGTLHTGIDEKGQAHPEAQLQIQADILNNSGEIVSQGAIQLQAQQINNRARSIKAAGDIQLGGGQLNNSSGQVFAQKTLTLEVTQTDNQQGALLAGADVTLKGKKLDNQQGTLAASGEIKLHLLDELKNNDGLLEAGKTLELKAAEVNNKTGKLRALGAGGSSLFMIGGTLLNDNGTIETANHILNLTAEHFSQNAKGQILALGALDIFGKQWDNQGQIRAGGALNLRLDKAFTHQGLLASGEAMRLSAPSLLNQQGALYSGADMRLQAARFTNEQGDIYAQGAFDFIQDANGNTPLSFSNLSGTIESGADIRIIAGQIDNRHVVDNLIESRKIAAQFYNSSCTDCSGDKKNVTWHLREIDRTFALSDLPGSALLAGGNLYLQGQDIRNEYSRLAAAGDIQLQGARFISRGAILGDTVLERWVQSARLKSRKDLIRRVNAFNARHWPIPEDAASAADISSELNALLGHFPTIEWRSATVDAQAGQPYQAWVQAGGTVRIEAAHIGNVSVQPSFNYVSGGKRADGAIGTQITPSDRQDTLQNQRIDLASGARLPTSAQGLFVPGSGSRYLIETNPALSSLRGYLNSAYLLRQLGYNPDTAQRRLGDGLYEQRLIRSALMAQNGRYYPTSNDEAHFKQLMDNGIAAAKALQLIPGIALSAEQVAALTQDMVWLEEREVGGEKVLAPVLYLAQGSSARVAGSVISGGDVLLADTLGNSGALNARSRLQVLAQGSIENSGRISAGGALALLARQRIDNSGQIEGQSVQLWAVDGDIHNLRTIDSHASQSGNTRRQQSLVHSAASITASGDLQMQAGGDIDSSGSQITAAGHIDLQAGGDLKLQAAQAHHEQSSGGKRYQSQSETRHYPSNIRAGGRLSAQSGGDMLIAGSTVQATQDITLASGGHLVIRSVVDETYQEGRSSRAASRHDQFTQQQSQIRAEGNLRMDSSNDLDIVASVLESGGHMALNAQQDLHILSAQNERYDYSFKQSRRTFSSKSREQESYQSHNVASQLTAGGDLAINARQTASALHLNGGRDVSVVGSHLSAGGDLLLGATRDIQLLSASEASGQYSKTTRSGFSLGSLVKPQHLIAGGLISGGLLPPLAPNLQYQQSGQRRLNTQATQIASSVQAGQNVTLASGHDLNLRASQIRSGQDLSLYAGLLDTNGDINLHAAHNSAYQSSEHWKKQSGLSFTGNGLAFSTAKRAGQMAQSSVAVGSEVLAASNASLYAERDINSQGILISAGQNLNLQSGRDLRISAAQNLEHSHQWKTRRQTGLQLSSDQNGYSAFAGNDLLTTKNTSDTQSAAASLLHSGQDLSARAGRDLWQIGSDLIATRDIDLQAARHIAISAAEETQQQSQQRIHQRNGLTVNISHNYGNTKDAVNGAGKGEDNISRASGTLKAIDSVAQFTSGPSNSLHLGNKAQVQDSQSLIQTARGSTQQAGRDLKLRAGQNLDLEGNQSTAGRDILIAGENIRIDVAKGGYQQQSSQTTRQSGLNSSASSSNARGGIGASYGYQRSESEQEQSHPGSLQAARNIDILAAQDLLLRGTQAQAAGDIRLKAGHDLSILAAQNQSREQTSRHSGGGEVGVALGGEDGIALYASVDYGKGHLDRQAAKQHNADIRAEGNLQLQSAQDTQIKGAYLEGQNIDVNTGRNLHIASTADTGKVQGKERDASVTVSIGYGGKVGVSGSAGFGKTDGKTDWIDQQTALVAKDRLTIYTENHSQIDAAIIHSESGHLTLDTNTLGYSHHQGIEREHGWYLNAGGSYSFGGGGSADNPAKAVPDQSQNDKSGQNSWNLSGHDYQKDRRQNVLATIGDGQIIVRNDPASGKDSLIGINRDINNSYQITRDYSRNTQFYLSSSSIDAIEHPEQTWATWKTGLKEYGLSSAWSFTNMTLLAMKAKNNAERRKKEAEKNNKPEDEKALTYGIQALAWIPGLLVDSADKLNGATGGLFAGAENHGGLYTQFFALLTGDLQLMRTISRIRIDDETQKVYFDKNNKTELVSTDIKRFDGKFNTEERIGVNGILNDLKLAAKNVAEQTGGLNKEEGNILGYNPTHGALGDLLESGVDKLFGLFGERSATASNLNRFLNRVSKEESFHSLVIAGHSQGALLLKRGLEGVKFEPKTYTDRDGNPKQQDLYIQMSGAPADAVKAHKVMREAGFLDDRKRIFQINRLEETVMGGLPKTDFVADILGGNAQYSANPRAYQLGGWFSLPALMTEKSPHSNYSCSVCQYDKLDDVNRQVRDRFTNPTLIDKEGHFYKRDQ